MERIVQIQDHVYWEFPKNQVPYLLAGMGTTPIQMGPTKCLQRLPKLHTVLVQIIQNKSRTLFLLCYQDILVERLVRGTAATTAGGDRQTDLLVVLVVVVGVVVDVDVVVGVVVVDVAKSKSAEP